MSVDRAETLFAGGLWFARLDQFGDGLEGSLPSENRIGLLAHHPPLDASWIEHEYGRGILRSYALCWHRSNGDPSQHIWDSFSSPVDGVSVATTPDRLRAALKPITGPTGPVHFGVVRYVNHQVDTIPEYNVLEAAFVVRQTFSSEHEARVVVHTHGTAAYDCLYGKNGPFGPLVTPVSGDGSPGGGHDLVGGHADGTALVLDIDPRQMITEIIAHPRMRPGDYARVCEVVERHGLVDRLRPIGATGP